MFTRKQQCLDVMEGNTYLVAHDFVQMRSSRTRTYGREEIADNLHSHANAHGCPHRFVIASDVKEVSRYK